MYRYNSSRYDDDDSSGIIDLTFVTQDKDAPEKRVYLCKLCPPSDSILIQQRDPEQLKFVEGGVIRWLCPRCGCQIDDTPENKYELRRRESIITIVSQDKPNTPIIQAVSSQTKDKLKGTAYAKEQQLSFDLEPNEESELRALGMQLDRMETRSSVSGRIVRKERKDKK